MSRFGTLNCSARVSSRKTTTKKSNASSVQPRNPARTACREEAFIGRAIVQSGRSATGNQMSSASLQGNLDSFKLPDVLSFLNSTQRTGMLTLTYAGKGASVFFRGGALIYAPPSHEPRRGRLAKAIADKRNTDAMKIEVSEVIYDAFVWKDGTFAFYDAIDLPSDAVTIAIDLSN